jgi:hypothetical protein
VLLHGEVCSGDRLRSFGVLRTPQDDSDFDFAEIEGELELWVSSGEARCCLFSHQYLRTLVGVKFVGHNQTQVLCFVC